MFTYWLKVKHIQTSEKILFIILGPFEILYNSATIHILWNNWQKFNTPFHVFSLWDETDAFLKLFATWKERNYLKWGKKL